MTMPHLFKNCDVGGPTGWVRSWIIEECRRLLLRPLRPTVPEVRPIIEAWYRIPGNIVGGSLHVVLEDRNFEDRSIRWNLDRVLKNGDEAAAMICMVLLECSKTQRKKVLCPLYRVAGIHRSRTPGPTAQAAAARPIDTPGPRASTAAPSAAPRPAPAATTA